MAVTATVWSLIGVTKTMMKITNLMLKMIAIYDLTQGDDEITKIMIVLKMRCNGASNSCVQDCNKVICLFVQKDCSWYCDMSFPLG